MQEVRFVIFHLINTHASFLQAMFEVIATEGSYVRSLDILVKHFMEDPGMNPDLPEGRRVLNRRQYHVIFSNVREVHEVAKRYNKMCGIVKC